MAEHNPLAEHYVARHPQKAMAVLERFTPADSAAFIDGLADDLAADLLSAMPPDQAAACLSVPPAGRVAMHLGNMPRRAAASILRRFTPERRSAVMAALAMATRMQIDLILHQPGHRIGAWIDARPPIAEAGGTVAAVRQRLGRAEAQGGELFLVDPAQRLQGVVPLVRLLAAAGDTLVESLAVPALGSLRANMTIETALQDPAWDDRDSLPVLDREGKLIGVVRHAVLRRAAVQERSARSEQPSGEYVSLANSVYVGLAEILATSIGRTDGNGPRPDGGETASRQGGGGSGQ